MNLVTTDSAGAELQNFSGAVNNLNQYTQFDQWGLTHDQNGNTIQKGTQNFTYDYRNRLLSVSGEGSGVTFKYDVLGRRIEKEVGAGTTKYYYSKNQVIEERDRTDTVTKQFIYGNGIDEALRMDRNESGTMIPYYYHTNGTGSVTAITDNTGTLVERIDYDIYGMPTFTDHKTDPNNPAIVSNSTVDNEVLYHGRRYDTESNLYYYRARYYDPIMGRFLQTDPMGYKDSMNLYQAFNMNGYNFVDPFGEKIYISGNPPYESLKALKQVFLDIGVDPKELKDAINIDKDEKGYFIRMDSFIPIAKNNTLDILKNQDINNQFIRYTTHLKKDNNLDSLNKALEVLFTEMIQSPVEIEFSVDMGAFSEHGGEINSDRFGRGIFIDPEHELYKGVFPIQIIVDPKPKIPTKYKEYPVPVRGNEDRLKLFPETIPLTLGATIVHEFGHAYALMEGYKPESRNHKSLNAEIAVLFENKYRARARTTLRAKLRYSHEYPWLYYKQYWSHFFRWSEDKGDNWFYYPESENPYK